MNREHDRRQLLSLHRRQQRAGRQSLITKRLLTALVPGHSERLREDPSLHPGSSLLVTALGESSLTAVQSSDQGPETRIQVQLHSS